MQASNKKKVKKIYLKTTNTEKIHYREESKNSSLSQQISS